jgi:hypothetical protein
MNITRRSGAAVAVRRTVATTVALAALAGVGGCGRAAPSASGPTPGATTGAIASPTPATGPTTAASDFCALIIKIETDSGLMVNKHFISPLKETLDELKAAVNAGLPLKDQLAATLPPNVRAAFLVEMQYFQALHDSDFSGTTPLPSGFTAAERVVEQYEISVCGITFDK